MDHLLFSLGGLAHFVAKLLDGKDCDALPAALVDEVFPVLWEGRLTPARTHKAVGRGGGRGRAPPRR